MKAPSTCKMERGLALQACLALRDGEVELVREYFVQLLTMDTEASTGLLHGVQDVLLAAIRRHQHELFCDLLLTANPVLLSLLKRGERAEECSAFLQSMTFVACDRRLVQVLPLLRRQLKTFLSSSADAVVLAKLWSELLNLCARMARRGWRDEASWLLRLLIWTLLRKDDLKIWQRALLELQMHVVVYARWDGFKNACAAYPEISSLLSLFVKRAASERIAMDMRQQYLLLALRFVRDLVANASRSKMADDMEIFLQWHDFLLEMAGDDAEKRGRLLLLLQLAINYWQGTRPRTSRKQMRYLEELLTPDLLDDGYRSLLSSIC